MTVDTLYFSQIANWVMIWQVSDWKLNEMEIIYILYLYYFLLVNKAFLCLHKTIAD